MSFPPDVVEQECRQQLWGANIHLEKEPLPLELPAQDQSNLGSTRKHGYFGMSPAIITGKDISPELSRYRRQFVTINARPYTYLPVLTAHKVSLYEQLLNPSNPFCLKLQPSNTGVFVMPQNIQWDTTVQMATKVRNWTQGFSRFGVIVCHRMKIPNARSTNGTGFDHQVIMTNPAGETVAWPDIESADGAHQMAAPVRTMLQNAQILKIDCDTSNPGHGYFTTVLPSTVSAAVMFKLFYPAEKSSFETFAGLTELQELAPRPEDNMDPKRFMFGIQMVRLTVIALLKRVRDLHLGTSDPADLNLVPYLREMILITLSIKNPEAVVAVPAENFKYPTPTAHLRGDTRPSLNTIYGFMDSTDLILRHRDFEVGRHVKISINDPSLKNLKSCRMHAENIWHGIPLPIPSVLASIDTDRLPHFCCRCGNPKHREIHCPETITFADKCRYPLCEHPASHVTKVCPTLHKRCQSCWRRGHRQIHHSSYSPVQLDSIFCWWSPQGAYTCLVFLESSKFRKSHVHDWHWIAHLQSVSRNASQLMMAALMLPFSPLPKPPKLETEGLFRKTPLWQFPPYLHKKVVDARKAAEELEIQKEAEKRQLAEQEEARKKKEAEEKEIEDLLAPSPRPAEESTVYSPTDEPMEAITSRSSTPVPATVVTAAVLDETVFGLLGEERLDKLQEACRVADACASSVGLPTSKTVIALQAQLSIMSSLLTENKIIRGECIKMEQRHQNTMARVLRIQAGMQQEIRALREEVATLKAPKKISIVHETPKVSFATGGNSTPLARPASPFDIFKEVNPAQRSRSPYRNNNNNNKRTRDQTPTGQDQGEFEFGGSNPRGSNKRRRRNNRSRSRNRGGNNNYFQGGNPSDDNSFRGRGRGGRGKRGGRGQGYGIQNQNQNQSQNTDTTPVVFYYQS